MSTFTPGPGYKSQADKLAEVQKEGSFELQSRLYSDPTAYSVAIGKWLLDWRSGQTSADHPTGYLNKLDYIQALLRGTGLSTNDSPRGVISNSDTKALKEVSLMALQNGIPLVDMLQELYKNKGSAGASKFSKQIATSIKLIDPTDAKASLSDAYFQAFGAFPTESQITNYMDLYNAEAKRQKGKSITTYNTSGTVTTQNTITSDEGFTQKEQQQFLADYLTKNFSVSSSADLGGQAKTLYDTIVATYKGNYQAEPDFNTVMGVIKNVIGSSDDKTAAQQLDMFLQQGRKVAAKQYLGLANELNAGEDVIKYSAPLASVATKLLGVNITADDALVKKALNFKDDKGQYRLMNDLEFQQAVEADPRYAVSAGAINKATSLASSITSKLGL